MRSRLIARMALTAILFTSAAVASNAQVVYEDPSYDFRGRFSATLEKKVAKGTHVYAEADVRGMDKLSKLDNVRGTLGLSCKVAPFLKTGLEYTGIWDGDDFRHRLATSLTGRVKFGEWGISLREKAMCTYRPGNFNLYQQPRYLLGLKSRLKVSYSSRRLPLEPYAYCELNNTLNGAKYSSTTADSMSYTDAYLRRLRSCMGLEWRVSKNHFLDIYFLADKFTPRDVDATKKGVLKTITYGNEWDFSLGLAYTFRL